MARYDQTCSTCGHTDICGYLPCENMWYCPPCAAAKFGTTVEQARDALIEKANDPRRQGITDPRD